MNVLVTGGAGYIGSVATELLLDRGHKVTVFDCLERGHRQAIDDRAAFVHGDLRQASDIRSVMERVRPDAVMHFAAYALVGESMERPDLYFGNNVGGVANLAEAMARVGVRKVVFSSTCATYGQPERVPITEDLPQKPTNPYGESKLMCEKIFNWYGECRGFEPVFLRYFNACGATVRFGEDHDPETHVIPNLLKVALGQRPDFRIFGDDYATPDGTCIRDYIHIRDLAEAHLLAVEKPIRGAFNLGTGSGFSVRDVLNTAREVTGHPIPIQVMPRRPGDPAKLVAGADKARQVLGWNPQYMDLRKIIASAWDWHKAHPQGYPA
jgi:UDP-glucose 4-epimerase